MNTLSLAAVSVPLALGLGLATGVLAHRVRAVRRAVETLLDVMQKGHAMQARSIQLPHMPP